MSQFLSLTSHDEPLNPVYIKKDKVTAIRVSETYEYGNSVVYVDSETFFVDEGVNQIMRKLESNNE